MKKSMKDPKNASVTISVEVPNPPDRSGRYVTKCEKCGKPISFPTPVEGEKWCKACKIEEVKSRVYLTCSDCGRQFYVRKEKAVALNTTGHPLPKRCYQCHLKHTT